MTFIFDVTNKKNGSVILLTGLFKLNLKMVKHFNHISTLHLESYFNTIKLNN